MRRLEALWTWGAAASTARWAQAWDGRPSSHLLEGRAAITAGRAGLVRWARSRRTRADSDSLRWVDSCRVTPAGVSKPAGSASLQTRLPIARVRIGRCVAAGNANHLPRWGGTAMLLSTQPIDCGLPAGTLQGAAMGRGVVDLNNNPVCPTHTGQAILMIDPMYFGNPAGFKAVVDNLSIDIRHSQRRTGFARNELPGGQGHHWRQRHRGAGIPTSAGGLADLATLAALAALTALAAEIGIAPLPPTVA